MLFNSYIFILMFLPVVLTGFYTIGRTGRYNIAMFWLAASSLFFYGWWNPVYLWLILSSIIFNFSMGYVLSNKKQQGAARSLLVMGIVFNLSLLGYYKYTNFFIQNVNALTGSAFHLKTIVLPLAISFFTFQQITYLVDAYKGDTSEHNFYHYCLFVTFFPQFIAGPIVHHKEMLPQFAKKEVYKFHHDRLSIGITIFIIGLFKKVVLADGAALYATPVFNAAEHAIKLSFLEAWGGVLAYTFQLYFDFSGYSDMAIGLGRMFGIYLPLNFNSPYKALNIIDFWRRWHMTLSRFLRDYLYIPLGGNRQGKYRRYVNLMITMLLGGLWHGAGWTFVVWGALHGIYLVINNLWHGLRRMLGHDMERSSWWGRGLAQTVTFLAVVVSWVFFRALSFGGAVNILKGMVGMNGFVFPASYLNHLNKFAGFGNYLVEIGCEFRLMHYFHGIDQMRNIIIVFIIAFFAPNTQQFMRKHNPSLEGLAGKIKPWKFAGFQWVPAKAVAVILSITLIYVFSKMTSVSEFLYFQF